MAQHITSTIVCDFDGITPAETHRFEFNNKTYTVDLGPLRAHNLNQINDAYERKIAELKAERDRKLAPYVAVAKMERAHKTKDKTKKSDAHKVRAWAADNGYNVGNRGRLSQDIRNAYLAAKKSNS